MKNKILENLKSFLNTIQIAEIIYSLVFIIIAIILIRNPEGVLHIISRILGISIIIYSIIRIIYAYKKKDSNTSLTAGLVLNIIFIMIGIFLVSIMQIIEFAFRIIFGISIIVSGIVKIVQSFKLKDNNLILSFVILFIGIVFTFGGIYIVTNQGAIISIIGYVILIFSVINILENIFLKYKSIL